MKYLLHTALGVFIFLLTTYSSEEINTAPKIGPQNFAIDENSAYGTFVGQFHQSWGLAFAEHDFLNWIFSKSK